MVETTRNSAIGDRNKLHQQAKYQQGTGKTELTAKYSFLNKLRIWGERVQASLTLVQAYLLIQTSLGQKDKLDQEKLKYNCMRDIYILMSSVSFSVVYSEYPSSF